MTRIKPLTIPLYLSGGWVDSASGATQEKLSHGGHGAQSARHTGRTIILQPNRSFSWRENVWFLVGISHVH